MPIKTPKSEFKLGFLTVLEVEGFGSCGGLLVVNHIGRPLEFHCTAPVSANRTQEILYGRSLKSFLYCDQIGKTLTSQSKSQLDLIVTDQPSLVGLETSADQTLVLLIDKSEIEQRQNCIASAHRLDMGSDSPMIPFAFAEDQNQLANATAQLQHFVQTLPLDEPFERIENAIDEAQSVAR